MIILPHLVVDELQIDTDSNRCQQLLEGEEWIAIGIEDADGYAESIAYCHPINAPLIVAACNEHTDLAALRDAVGRYLRAKGLHEIEQTGNDLQTAYAKLDSTYKAPQRPTTGLT